jgi:hypothetical protein
VLGWYLAMDAIKCLLLNVLRSTGTTYFRWRLSVAVCACLLPLALSVAAGACLLPLALSVASLPLVVGCVRVWLLVV